MMERWRPFRTAVHEPAPQAAIPLDKSHFPRYLNEALCAVHKSESARLTGKARRHIKERKYTLLSHREKLSRPEERLEDSAHLQQAHGHGQSICS